MILSKISSRRVVVLALIIIGSFCLLNLFKWKDYEEEEYYQFTADRSMYYSYLPAFFINNDPFFKSTQQPGAIYDLNFGDKKTVKYTIGMSVMYSPFFLMAYAIDPMTHDLAKYGLTTTFSRFIRIGSLFYFLLGFYFLLCLMLKFFNKWVVLFSSLMLFFGTNIMYYTLVEGEMPHIYLFSLLSMLLYFTDKWWEEKKAYQLYLISFLLGISVLVRPSELILILIPMFWGVYDKKSALQRLNDLRTNISYLLVAALVFTIVVLPQFLYWKILSGDFIIASYGDETFFFLDPKIIDYLFSYRKGWFIYTPLMFFAFIGFIVLGRYVKQVKFIFPLLIIMAIYINSSWWSWWFAGSFGARSILSLYPLMIFPLAAIITLSLKSIGRGIVCALMAAAILWLNVDFTNKYRVSLIHWDSMTKESFWFVFGKTDFSAEDIKHYYDLLESPDYEGAKNGSNR